MSNHNADAEAPTKSIVLLMPIALLYEDDRSNPLHFGAGSKRTRRMHRVVNKRVRSTSVLHCLFLKCQGYKSVVLVVRSGQPFEGTHL